ncbi:MAG: HupE/UreJ family protein [Actinomycetota bacterium]
MRPFLRKAIAVLAASLTVVVAIAAPASAHRNDESYLYLDIGDNSISGRAELPYPDLREVFGFELDGDDEEITAELEGRLDELQAYLLEETSIGADGQSWTIEFEGVVELLDEDLGANGLGYAIFPYDVVLPSSEVPQLIETTFTPFLDEIDDRNNIVLISNDWKRGVVEEEANELVITTVDNPSGTINLGESAQWSNFTRSIELGVDHIRTGPDHIFFVLVLLLTSVLVLNSGKWAPSPTFGASLKRVILVATMFTIAHSVTFTLAGIDVIPLPPSKLVETLIALSIGAAALHNIRPIFGHREWSIAFAFGLFHGMGFAGLVQDLDISRSTQLISLLGRNVGIEIGQIIIILISFPGLFLLRRTRVYWPLMVAASIGLALISGIWVIERVFEVDAGIEAWIDRLVKWPRSFWLAVAFTAVSAAYYQVEQKAGRLLALGSADDRESAEAAPAGV